MHAALSSRIMTFYRATGPWELGERVSVYDIYLFTLSQWLADDRVDIKHILKVLDHCSGMAVDSIVVNLLAAQGASA